jgi:predicted ester cyclase
VSTPPLVRAFYERIWNAGDLDAAEGLLAPGLSFRGSLGAELRGRDAFLDYVRSVRSALSGYHCEIVDCVAEMDRAFARMQFSGRHAAPFRGFAPTGREVGWAGAALFRFADEVIADLWVLGDLAGLDALLAEQAGRRPGTRVRPGE